MGTERNERGSALSAASPHAVGPTHDRPIAFIARRPPLGRQMLAGAVITGGLLLAAWATLALMRAVNGDPIAGGAWPGPAVAGTWALLLALTVGVVMPRRPCPALRRSLTPASAALATTGAALILAAVAASRAYDRTLVDPTLDVKVLWLSALAIVTGTSLAGRFPAASALDSLRGWGRSLRWPLAAATGAILALAVVTRLVRLDRFPSASIHDEWIFSIYARRARIDESMTNPFRTHDVIVQSDIWTWADGVLSRLMSDSPAAYRLLGAATGCLAVVTTMLLARRTLGTPSALAGGAIVATMPIQLWASRSSMANILDPLVLTTALWLTDRLLETRDRRDAIACGIALGLGYYGYFGARAFPLVVAVSLTPLLLRRPFGSGIANYARLGLWTLAGFLVTTAPMLAYAADDPTQFFERVNQVTTAYNHTAPTLGERFDKVLIALTYPFRIPSGLFVHATTTRVTLLGTIAPVCLAIGLAVWIASIAMRLAGGQRRLAARPGILLVAWGMLSVPISQTLLMESHRFLAITTLWALAAASGVVAVAWLAGPLLRRPAATTVVAAALLLAIAAQNLTYYFAENRQYDMWGDPEATLQYDIGWRYHTAPDDTAVIAVAWEDLKLTWAGAVTFWAPAMPENVSYRDTLSPQEPPFGAPVLASGQTLILGPNHLDDACTVMAANPNALVGATYDRYGTLLSMTFTNDPAFPFRTGETPAGSTFATLPPPACP